MFEAIAARKSYIAEQKQPSQHKKYRRGTTMSNPDLDPLDPSVKLDPENINRHRSTIYGQRSTSQAITAWCSTPVMHRSMS